MSKSSIGPLACNGTASAEVPEVPADPASGAEERAATRLWAKSGSWEPGAAGGGGGGATASTGGSASGNTGGGCLGVAAAEAFPLLPRCHGGVGGAGGAFPSHVGGGPAFVRDGGTGGDGLGEEGAQGGDGGGGAGIVDGSGAGGADAADPAGGSSRGGCGVTADVAPSAG